MSRLYWGIGAVQALLWTVLLSAPLAAQSPFEVRGGSVYRDGVIVAAQGIAYFAAYDRDAVTKVALDSGKLLQEQPVGKGPSALALSLDGQVLACVNRLDGTVSLLHAGDLTVLATVPTGDGACDVAALPQGAFAVTNSFSDSIVIVPSSGAGSPQPLSFNGGVPNLVAASNGALAVTSLAPPQLRIYGVDTGVLVNTVSLPDAPDALAGLADGRFVVAAGGHLQLRSGADGALVTERILDAGDLVAQGDRALALAGQSALILNDTLKTVEQLPLPFAAVGLVAGPEVVIALSPNTKQWAVYSKTALPAPTPVETAPAPPAPAEKPAPPATPTVVEAQPAVAPQPTPAPPAQEEPAPAQSEGQWQSAEHGEANEEQAQSTTQTVTQKVREEVVENAATATPESRALSPVPLGGIGMHTPRPANSPSVSPLPPSRKAAVSDIFRQGVFLGSGKGGFTAPDWRNPIEKLQAQGELEVIDGRYELHNNVEMKLEDTLFRADNFSYDTTTGTVTAEGHVSLSQPDSTLTADKVVYTLPPEGSKPAPAPVEPLLGSEQRRYEQGEVEAENVDIVEPQRELKAAKLSYDFANSSGNVEDASGHAGIYYFGAQKLHILGPSSVDATDLWVTTCDRNPPHYRVRLSDLEVREGRPVVGESAQLQIGGSKTPVYWPKWKTNSQRENGLNFDFDSGRDAELGSYVNFGQSYALTPNFNAGPRLFPTEKEGIGFGIDADYDYMYNPSSWLFRSTGDFKSLYTTEDRGYAEFYHRQELTPDTVLLLQAEQWSDRDFVKDFYYDVYRNRTEPRTFGNVTYIQPSYIATGTVRAETNGWVTETERLPELTFHLLERPIAPNLYLTYDSAVGYNEREPAGTYAGRFVNVGRLTYDLNLNEALDLTPFWEVEGTWYSHQRRDGSADFLLANTFGATLQTRLHRAYPGKFGFSGFKHVIVPSVTYSYRPTPTMDAEDTPRFDAYDNAYGRSRLEAKIANVVFGRDAASGQTWQVARITAYAGSDFWNESKNSDDYELEVDVRPRPYWGVLMIGEHHSIRGDADLDEPFFLQRAFLQLYEDFYGEPLNPEAEYQYNAQYGDYDRFLSYLYYDDTNHGGRFNGRLGFAYTETQDKVFNREILYGAGYQLGEKWAAAFEHRYDFERGELTRQTYEIRRNLHCWEAALQVTDRESGWDIGVLFNIAAFPGTRVAF